MGGGELGGLLSTLDFPPMIGGSSECERRTDDTAGPLRDLAVDSDLWDVRSGRWLSPEAAERAREGILARAAPFTPPSITGPARLLRDMSAAT